jgi:peptidoglycan/LPS O-acetylase OafA/YrhL
MNAYSIDRRNRPSDRIAVRLMAFAALTLAAFATLHLSGALRLGAKTSYGAGFAEAIIGIVLAGGAGALMRSPHRGRRPALLATGFAIFGFVVGLTFTVSGGAVIDLIYHLTMLPVLIATMVLLARRTPASGHPRGHADDASVLERRRPRSAPARAGGADR